MKKGDLLAYADDLLVTSNSPSALNQIIKGILDLEKEWGLKLNK